MSKPNRKSSKAETTGSLRKISTRDGQNSKISKSTANMTRTSNMSKVTDKSANRKSLENVMNMLKKDNVAESKVEPALQSPVDKAKPQEALKEQVGQNQEGRKYESTAQPANNTTRSGMNSKISSTISKISRASDRGKVKDKPEREKSFKNENMLRKRGITATEVGTMLQKPEATARREGGLSDAANENPESKEEERKTQEPTKCFDDWREFYLQIFGTVKSKSDLIVAFTHYILIKNGFRCLGLGDDRTYADNEEGFLNLPEGWNHFPKYTIRYIYNRMLHLLLAIHLDHRLLINLLNTRTNVVTNVTIFPEITVRATCGGPIDVLIPHPEKLAQSLYFNLMQTFTDTAACDLPPKILSHSSQRDDPWHELEARHSNDVYPIAEDYSVAQLVGGQDGQALEAENKHFGSIDSRQSEKRASWANMKPQIANAKKLKPLKTALEEAVPPLKEAFASYMETMVDNWTRIYGREVMKSGQLAIQDLAEQRKMIEKYMDLVKPVTAPKGGFVIYRTKVTLDDSKQKLLRETFEKSLLELKAGSKINRNEFTKPFTEAAHDTRLAQPKSKCKADPKYVNPKREAEAQERKIKKNQANCKHIQPKVCTGIKAENISLKSSLKREREAEVTSAKTKQISSKLSKSRIEKEINNAYKLQGLRKSTVTGNIKRIDGGSDTNSVQQNSTTNSEGKAKRKRLKLKSAPSAIHNPKYKKCNAIKLLNSALKRTFGKAEPQVKLLRSSPIKKIRFNLPKPSTISYLSNKWPSTYQSVEKLLNSSFPFRVETRVREHGGAEQPIASFDHYNLSNLLTIKPFNNTPTGVTETKKQRKSHHLEVAKKPVLQNSSSYLLQSIEEHFADQIEAKRLELLEMVRSRDLQRIMGSGDSIEIKSKFIQPKQEVDVGCFVQPADEWSQWEFKKKLKEIREKEILNENHNNPNFKE